MGGELPAFKVKISSSNISCVLECGAKNCYFIDVWRSKSEIHSGLYRESCGRTKSFCTPGCNDSVQSGGGDGGEGGACIDTDDHGFGGGEAKDLDPDGDDGGGRECIGGDGAGGAGALGGGCITGKWMRGASNENEGGEGVGETGGCVGSCYTDRSKATTSITITCWNCRGLSNSVPYILELLNTIPGILVLSEHWLWPYEVYKLREISENIMATGKADARLSEYGSGRGFGGVGIMWHKSVGASAVEGISSDRICAIRCELLPYLQSSVCIFPVLILVLIVIQLT